MVSPAFVLAYHGCDEEVGERILRNEAHVTVSKNKYDWLGHGAYFWENSPRRALQWAEFIKSRPQNFDQKIKKPFVVGAIINLGNCLDLTDAESLSIVKATYRIVSEALASLKIEMPQNLEGHDGDSDRVQRNLDCMIINSVHGLRNKHAQSFETVRGIFTEGKELYPGAKILEKTHVQICVRDPKESVFAYFRPRQ